MCIDYSFFVAGWCYLNHEESLPTVWAKIAFWEKRTRIGAMQSVNKNDVIICNSSHSVPSANDKLEVISLDKLDSKSECKQCHKQASKAANQNPFTTSGVVLSHCNNGEVWLFNQDERPVFILSATLNFDPKSSCPNVVRLDPGSCSCIFDPEAFPYHKKLAQNLPIDPYSIKVSLAKGFGPGYTRSQISSCPSWFEVLLNIDRN